MTEEIEVVDTNDEDTIIPLLASRGVVVFPNMVIPLLVGREKSIEALEEAMLKEKKIIVTTQKDESIEINNLGKLLCNENIHSVLVEGGAKTISYFLKNKFFDEINVYVSSKIIGRGLSPTAFGKVDEIKNGIELQKVEHFSFGDNIMIKGARKSVHWID